MMTGSSALPVPHLNPTPVTYAWYPGAMSRLDPTGTSSLSGQSQGPAVAMALDQLQAACGEALAKIQALGNAWGVH